MNTHDAQTGARKRGPLAFSRIALNNGRRPPSGTTLTGWHLQAPGREGCRHSDANIEEYRTSPQEGRSGRGEPFVTRGPGSTRRVHEASFPCREAWPRPDVYPGKIRSAVLRTKRGIGPASFTPATGRTAQQRGATGDSNFPFSIDSHNEKLLPAQAQLVRRATARGSFPPSSPRPARSAATCYSAPGTAHLGRINLIASTASSGPIVKRSPIGTTATSIPASPISFISENRAVSHAK